MKPRFFSQRNSLSIALSITLVLSHIPRAHAADGTWTTDGSSTWSSTTNWLDGIVADGVDSTADFSTLDITASRTVQLDSSRTLGNLTFGDTDIVGFTNWTLRNNSNPSNILTLAVNAGSPTITTNTDSFIGAIIDGSDGFTKAGTASLLLSGANVYSGITSVNSGTLIMEHNSALGAAGIGNETIVASGASLFVRNSNALVAESLTISGTGGNNFGALHMQSGSTWAGSIGLAADASIFGAKITGGVDLAGHKLTVDGNIEISGGISGSGSLSNRGFTVLSGVNTYTGSTEILSGTLQFAKSSALYEGTESSWTKENISVSSGGTLAVNVGGVGEFSLAQSKTLLSQLTTAIDNNGLKAGSNFAIDTSNAIGATTFDQAITDSTGTGSGSLGFTKLGTGTLILNQANTYTGPTIIKGGTLKISGSGTLGNQGALILNGGSLDLGGTTQAVGAVQFDDGSISSGSLIATSYNLAGSGHIAAGLGGVGANLTVDGSSIVYLEGRNTYTGQTIIDADSALGLRKSVSLYNADTSKWTKENISVISYDGLYGGSIMINVGGAGEFTTAQAKTLLSNLTTSINYNGLMGGSSFGIDTSNASGPVIFDQVIADSTGDGAGSLSLHVKGAQALALNQANTYSGNTSLLGGHLQVGHANAIPSGAGKGVIITQEWTSGDSKLDINGFNVSVNAIQGSGTMIFNDAVGTDKTLTLGSNNPAHSMNSFSGQIADNSGTGGTLSLDKVGTITQILDGENTYTGETTVRAGTLVVNGSISTSILTTVKNGATLSGSGTVGALLVEEGGKIAPGNSPGILHTGDYDQAGTLNLEILGTEVGTQYDQVDVSGTVDLSGIFTLTLLDFTPSTGNLFFVINNDETDAINGTFSGLALGSEFTMAGWLWEISYDADFDSKTFDGGNDVAFKSLSAIPEPRAALMGGLGLICLLRRRRA